MIRYPDEILLVIVGAGASFDCLQVDWPRGMAVPSVAGGWAPLPWDDIRPPLTQNLVAGNAVVRHLANRYPDTRALVDALRERLGVLPGPAATPAASLEDALLEYLEMRVSNPHVARNLAAFRFFLRDYLWLSTNHTLGQQFTGGITNYTRLVRLCYEWATKNHSQVCFINFNYDTLLDQACADYWGLDIENFDSYISDPFASLLKPHGSIRWAWKLGDGPVLNSAFEAAVHRIREGEPADVSSYKLVTGQPPNDTTRTSGLTADLPALALPVAGKTDFVWPLEQRHFLDALSSSVRRLLLIGWRAAEPHFVRLLDPLVMTTNRALIVTGGPNADTDFSEIVTNLGGLGSRLDLKKSVNGFRSALSDNQLSWLLGPVTWPSP